MTPNEIADALEAGLVETYNGTARINATHVKTAIAHLRAPAALPELPPLPRELTYVELCDLLPSETHWRDPVTPEMMREIFRRAYALAALAASAGKEKA